MKALVGAFNQEKALVGAFSVIVQPVVELMEHYTALIMMIKMMTSMLLLPTWMTILEPWPWILMGKSWDALVSAQPGTWLQMCSGRSWGEVTAL